MFFFFRILLALLLVLPGLADAQTKMYPSGYSACGEIATGYNRSLRDKANPRGKVVTGAFVGMAVSPEGYWFECQPWVPPGGDPAMPRPEVMPTCEGKTTYEFWEVDDKLCSSVPPGESTASNLKLVETEVGRVRYITSDPTWTKMGKATYGNKMFRCVALPNGKAEWRTEGKPECLWANEVPKK